jgi:tripartite-type tricarboxylate transporter receptor subunit TctC
MQSTRRQFIQVAATAGLASGLPAWAQSGTAKIEVGFAAGGTLDVIARRIADKLRGNYADTVIVDSRVGAGGRIANEAIKNAAPDGLNMVLSPSSPIVIFPHVYSKLSYNPTQDLIAVTPVCSNAQAFAVGPAVPGSVQTLAQFVAWAKAGNKAFYGTPAAGSIMHFQGLVFSGKAGIDLTHVPYRGMAAVVPDLIGANLVSTMGVLGDLLPHIASGKIRVLAVTSEKRSSYLPQVPTFAELGYPEVTGEDWYGLFLPAKTPAAMVDKLRDATHAAMRDKAFLESLSKLGFEAYALSSTEFSKRIIHETAKWGPIVKASGFTVES